jgi:beta-glucosidase
LEAFAPNGYDPLYPFGHGLSYSTFVTYGLSVDKRHFTADDTLTVTVNVRNTGQRAGKTTVLVYLHDVAASVSRPNKQLKAFKKIALAVQEEQMLSFILTPYDFSFIGMSMTRIIEAGDFVIMVGDECASVTFKSAGL